jgi:hypothetical protein
MYHWHDEILSELRRAELARELEQLQAARRALPTSGARWFERPMLGLANWMIRTGKQLRCRYAAQPLGGTQQPTGNFAR